MPRAKYVSNQGKRVGIMIFCPGCKRYHRVMTSEANDGQTAWWDFNGNLDLPTFSPSILTWSPNVANVRCHSFVTNGKIQFLDDCEHELKNQIVDLPDLDNLSEFDDF